MQPQHLQSGIKASVPSWQLWLALGNWRLIRGFQREGLHSLTRAEITIFHHGMMVNVLPTPLTAPRVAWKGSCIRRRPGPGTNWTENQSITEVERKFEW